MSYWFHPDAQAEMVAARQWYESRQKGVGKRLCVAVEKAIATIERMPRAAPFYHSVDPELGIRRLMLNRFPFAVVYLLRGNRPVILAIAHTSREPGYWINRLKSSPT